MKEADTRAELIDPQLKESGWGRSVNELTEIKREYPVYPGQISRNKKGSPLSADYVLIYKNRKLAAIEAKADEVDVSEGVAQAKNYATLLNLNYTFAANGKEIKQMRLTSLWSNPLIHRANHSFVHIHYNIDHFCRTPLRHTTSAYCAVFELQERLFFWLLLRLIH